MKSAVLKIHNAKDQEIGEMEIDEIPADASETGLIKHYNRYMRTFMRHLGMVHVGAVIWKA